jgi:hypothetical protein
LFCPPDFQVIGFVSCPGLSMARSTMQVDPNSLAEVVHMLRLAHIDIVGSESGDGVVTLVIQGDIVPEADQVTIEVVTVTGSIYSQITVRCNPCHV